MPRIGKSAAVSNRGGAVPHPDAIFDPVARGLDVIGDRWVLVLVHHLLDSPRGFQELRKRTGIAPRVLSSRLRDLVSAGFIETVAEGSRSVYGPTDQGRSLRPIIVAIARWWIRYGLEALDVDAAQFTETSAQSIMDALPFMLREDRAEDADITFEIRLSGSGGGVWTVRIADGACSVRTGFAEHADVRYTADAAVWCGLALGLADAGDLYRRGLIVKDGGRQAMDRYFYQVSSPERRQASAADANIALATASTKRERRST